MTEESDNVVKIQLFDEAVRIGNQSVTQANQYLRVNRIMAERITLALRLLESGRVRAARDILQTALRMAAKELL